MTADIWQWRDSWQHSLIGLRGSPKCDTISSKQLAEFILAAVVVTLMATVSQKFIFLKKTITNHYGQTPQTVIYKILIWCCMVVNFIREEWQFYFYKTILHVTFSKIYGLAHYEHRFSFSLSKIRKGINSFTLALDSMWTLKVRVQSYEAGQYFLKYMHVYVYIHIHARKCTCMCPFTWMHFICAEAYHKSPIHIIIPSRRIQWAHLNVLVFLQYRDVPIHYG